MHFKNDRGLSVAPAEASEKRFKNFKPKFITFRDIKSTNSIPALNDGQLCFRCGSDLCKAELSMVDLTTFQSAGGGLCRNCIEQFRYWLAAGRCAALEGRL